MGAAIYCGRILIRNGVNLSGGVPPSGWTTGHGKTDTLCRPQSEKDS